MNDHNPEWERTWRDWLATRPDDVRAIAEHFPPWVPVRIKATGEKGHVYSFGEKEGGGICVQVNVFPDENPDSLHSILLPEGHRAIGLAPDDLEPWTEAP